MRAREALIVPLLAAFLLPACTPEPAQDPQPPRPERSRFSPAHVTATEAQAGTTLNVRTRLILEVRLHGNATIDPPLVWSLAAAPPHLRAEGEQVLSDDPGADGAGATWLFRFRAAGEGRGALAFTGGGSGRRIAFDVVTPRDRVVLR